MSRTSVRVLVALAALLAASLGAPLASAHPWYAGEYGTGPQKLHFSQIIQDCIDDWGSDNAPVDGHDLGIVSALGTTFNGVKGVMLWAWDFGDGATSTTQSPSHAFAAKGRYHVTLTVKDGRGVASAPVTHDVVVPDLPPVASFDVAGVAQTAKAVAFHDASADPDGTIASSAWTFGDGNATMGADVTHAYAKRGDYAANLTVTDNDGTSASATRTVKVRDAPTASLNFSARGLAVAFDATGSRGDDAPIANFSWSIGNGTVAVGPYANVTFNGLGPYLVNLTVTDARGFASNASRTITLDPNAPLVAFRILDETPVVGDVVRFRDATVAQEGRLVAWSWDFGDGGTSAESNATHAFATPGVRTVRLNVTDSLGASGETTLRLRVRSPPVPKLAVDAVGLTATASSNGTSDPDGRVLSGAIDWGDGSAPQVGFDGTHRYAYPGNFTVRLTVTDDDGLAATAFRDVALVARPVVATARAEPFAQEGETFHFHGEATSPDGDLVAVRWSFGDGARGEGADATHAYTAPGLYTATFAARDSNGALGLATVDVTVEAKGDLAPPPASTTPHVAPTSGAPDATNVSAAPIPAAPANGATRAVPSLGPGPSALVVLAAALALARAARNE